MAAANTAGTPKKVIVGGIPYDVTADCNPQANFSGYTLEVKPTSGRPTFVQTRQPYYLKGVDLAIGVQDYNVLCKAVAALQAFSSYPIGLGYQDGTVVTYAGRVNIGDHNGNENKATVDLYFEDAPVAAG